MRIVLASQSPRRFELLAQAGVQFDVIAPSPSAESDLGAPEPTPALVARLARQKAQDVARRIEGPAIIVACDTVADVDGCTLGKPRDRVHAEQMLRMLSGRAHAVYSGLCVLSVPNGSTEVRVEKSELYMRPLSEQQIEEYLDSDGWVGKSGAFGYQDDLPWLQLISGTADNVVGLPIATLMEMLQRHQ